MTQPELIRYVFGDDLMATHFSLFIEAAAGEADRVRSVAEEFFDEIRRLESLLSRFIEDSEVSQINRLHAGETSTVSPETFQCLETAISAAQLTDSHFDIAFRSGHSIGMAPAFRLLRFPRRVLAETEKLDIDLGGIGKGFALDYGSQILLSYGYDRALLCAGTSTILALQPPRDSAGWQVMLNDDSPLFLSNKAVSCSGKSVRGEHIFDVHTQKYETKADRIWIQAETAAVSDAFSTAAMTMDDEQRQDFVALNGLK